VGNGQHACQYLAPYIFRVALSNNRIVRLANDQVAFRYRASDTGQNKLCTLPAEEFIHRFLQHVLPKAFVKVRYYGFFSPGRRPCFGLPGGRRTGPVRVARSPAACFFRLSPAKMAGLVRCQPLATCDVPRLCGRIVPSSPRQGGSTR